jgi:polysaccharide deacetylase family protein (PEP-CTERM system associated)
MKPRGEQSVTNALTFDVEDWHQLVEWKLNGDLPKCSPRVVAQTRDILEMLAARDVRATFFILGLVADAHPALVREIAAAGHEVGSHGWSHRLVYRQSPEEFRAETQRSKSALEDILGRPVLGYRAAEFSVTNASRWALDILADLGFKYDSSIFPIRGRRYGMPDAPVAPHNVKTSAGDLVELPLSVVSWRGRRYPVGGGGYFRLAPYAVTRAAIRRVNRSGRAAVVYFHPYEFSRSMLLPRLTSARAWITGGRYLVFHNLNRAANRRRLARLLNDCRFAPAAEILHLE